MNRAEKTKQYLDKQLDQLKCFETLRDSRKEFFAEVRRFREATILHLKRTAIVGDDDLKELDRLLAEIDTCKTKGSENEVYWSRVGPVFNRVILTLQKLRASMDEVEVRFHLKMKDYLTGASFLEKIAMILIGIVLGILITYLASTFL